ncbi:MAG TPA: rhodanese-related sulfurtransferase [Candidatus Saccharimonadales bacterium]|nr:rhodanese-related sulfurtransferase [Candidatus Saccharimonadales bacterium]
MQKIILYYLFTPVKDPEAVRLWQRTLCEKLGLKGRILLAEHGINGTLGGEVSALKNYIKETKTYPEFKNISFKWSEGSVEDFPKLVVKVRPEIVTFGVADKIKVNDKGIVGGGKHLKPKQVHELVKQRGEDVVFFDGRNAYEAAIGKFKDAVVPDVEHTRDFAHELQDPKYDELKKKPVVTYCTGGIRCEVLSMIMKDEGFEEVYQIDGGIAKYGEEFGDDGLWEGSLYVFDDRIATKFSDKAKDIASCIYCDGKTSRFINCDNKNCNKRILVCSNCQNKMLCPDCAKQTTLA